MEESNFSFNYKNYTYISDLYSIQLYFSYLMQIWNLIEYLCKFKNLNRLFDILTLYFIYYFIFKFSIMSQTFTIPGLIKYKEQSKRRREKGPHRNFNEEKGIRERIIRQKSYRGTPRIFRVISTCGLSSSFQ